MKRKHCDLCGLEIEEECSPICELTAISSTGDKAKLRLKLGVINLISKKDLPFRIDGYDFLPSIPEMEKQEEGYDVCDKCWGKLLKSIKVEDFRILNEYD